MSRTNYLELRSQFFNDPVTFFFNYSASQGLSINPFMFPHIFNQWLQRIRLNYEILLKIMDTKYEIIYVQNKQKQIISLF